MHRFAVNFVLSGSSSTINPSFVDFFETSPACIKQSVNHSTRVTVYYKFDTGSLTPPPGRARSHVTWDVVIRATHIHMECEVSSAWKAVLKDNVLQYRFDKIILSFALLEFVCCRDVQPASCVHIGKLDYWIPLSGPSTMHERPMQCSCDTSVFLVEPGKS